MPDVFETNDTSTVTDPLAELVGPDKKFKTPADLAKGKIEADAFIESLKRENAGLRDEASKKFDADAQLKELRDEITALRGRAPVEPSKGPTDPSLTVEGVQALVRETLTQAERNRSAQQNITVANDAMVKHYGDPTKATDAVRAKATELGLSVDDLKAMAEKSPTAFQKIMLGDNKAQSDTGPLDVHSQTPSGGQQRAAEPGTKEYFEAIRSTNPKEYWKPEVQMALHRAVAAGTYKINS